MHISGSVTLRLKRSCYYTDVLKRFEKPKALKPDYIYNWYDVLEKGFQAFIYIYYKSFDKQMFQPDWLILHILHQSFEIERPKEWVEQQRD